MVGEVGGGHYPISNEIEWCKGSNTGEIFRREALLLKADNDCQT